MWHVHVIVVSWFLQCMGYVPREGCMYFRGQSPRKYIQHEGMPLNAHASIVHIYVHAHIHVHVYIFALPSLSCT